MSKWKYDPYMNRSQMYTSLAPPLTGHLSSIYNSSRKIQMFLLYSHCCTFLKYMIIASHNFSSWFLYFYQRPKRKPLREFFVDEDEALESKLIFIYFLFSNWKVSFLCQMVLSQQWNYFFFYLFFFLSLSSSTWSKCTQTWGSWTDPSGWRTTLCKCVNYHLMFTILNK